MSNTPLSYRTAFSRRSNIDELFSDNAPFSTPFDSRGANYFMIYDGAQYDANYGTPVSGVDLSKLGPQHTEVDTKQVVATVAAFRAATLDVDMHAISIPIDLSCRLSDRIQARVSFGPTLNMFNEELTTET